MERYFTTIALLGVDEGNLPVHRYVIIIVGNVLMTEV